ncbi:hypothetical protein M1D93_20310 (plasmid) [Arthrobacter sp. Z1-9]
MPSPGPVNGFRVTGGFEVRLDGRQTHRLGQDRQEAITPAMRAVEEMEMDGVTTMAQFQGEFVASHEFRSGDFNPPS